MEVEIHAGHIPGAAMVEIETPELRLLWGGIWTLN